MKQRSSLKRKKRLSPVSKKRSSALKEYYKLRKEFLERNSICQVWIAENIHVIFENQNWLDLAPRSTEIHHRKGRGKYLNEVKFWLAVCRESHDRIHKDPAWAYQRGYLLRK